MALIDEITSQSSVNSYIDEKRQEYVSIVLHIKVCRVEQISSWFLCAIVNIFSSMLENGI